MSLRSDPQKEAEAYLAEKKIDKIFETLLARLSLAKPDDHLSFLSSAIEEMKAQQQAGEHMSFFFQRQT